LLPSVIATARNHPDYDALIGENLFLGWTGVVWIAVLVRALTGK
jgi:hypothetical protein